MLKRCGIAAKCTSVHNQFVRDMMKRAQHYYFLGLAGAGTRRSAPHFAHAQSWPGDGGGFISANPDAAKWSFVGGDLGRVLDHPRRFLGGGFRFPRSDLLCVMTI
jgi:hypothetical protein